MKSTPLMILLSLLVLTACKKESPTPVTPKPEVKDQPTIAGPFKYNTKYTLINESWRGIQGGLNRATYLESDTAHGGHFIEFFNDSVHGIKYAVLNNSFCSYPTYPTQYDTINYLTSTSINFPSYHTRDRALSVGFNAYAADSTYYLFCADSTMLRFKP